MVKNRKISKQEVYNLLKEIPRGKVTTYKEIAECLNTKAYQAIGQILKHNPNPIIVPCHRVVKTNGSLGGYAGKNYQDKINLLENEKVQIENFNVNLNKYLWKIPNKNKSQ
jgi:methylated-DNA-[protein]-cysteine S-methyltransferase